MSLRKQLKSKLTPTLEWCYYVPPSCIFCKGYERREGNVFCNKCYNAIQKEYEIEDTYSRLRVKMMRNMLCDEDMPKLISYVRMTDRTIIDFLKMTYLAGEQTYKAWSKVQKNAKELEDLEKRQDKLEEDLEKRQKNLVKRQIELGEKYEE